MKFQALSDLVLATQKTSLAHTAKVTCESEPPGADGWGSDRKVILLDRVKRLNLPVELCDSVPTVAEESRSASASSSTAETAAPRNTFEVRSFRLPEPEPAAAAQEPPKEWAGLINKTAQFVARLRKRDRSISLGLFVRKTLRSIDF